MRRCWRRIATIYSTQEKMGTLSFSDLEVQPLDEHFATVTGKFHLERTAAGGGNASGSFLLVFEKTRAGLEDRARCDDSRRRRQ